MRDTDPEEETQQLERMIRAELEDRDDVLEYEITETDEPGVHVAVEGEDETRRYHVTLERFPEEPSDTHWSFLGVDEKE